MIGNTICENVNPGLVRIRSGEKPEFLVLRERKDWAVRSEDWPSILWHVIGHWCRMCKPSILGKNGSGFFSRKFRIAFTRGEQSRSFWCQCHAGEVDLGKSQGQSFHLSCVQTTAPEK